VPYLKVTAYNKDESENNIDETVCFALNLIKESTIVADHNKKTICPKLPEMVVI